jgi:hypothetical protein
MTIAPGILIVIGGLEFGSITFLLVSFLMAISNFKIQKKTESSTILTVLSIFDLGVGGILIMNLQPNGVRC